MVVPAPLGPPFLLLPNIGLVQVLPVRTPNTLIPPRAYLRAITSAPTLTTMTAPTIGLAEAARACGVSESTIRRRRTELLELGAAHGPKGWKIPIPALVQLGLMAATTGPDVMTAPEPPRESPVEATVTPSTLAEVEALREALTAAELRAAVAEARAEERERVIKAQAQALRMLEAPVRTPANPASEVPSETARLTPQPPAAKRRWWQLI